VETPELETQSEIQQAKESDNNTDQVIVETKPIPQPMTGMERIMKSLQVETEESSEDGEKQEVNQ
jgi:hypothetical protein